ncbi:MAG TPA: tail fiber protein [Planctomycetota bacterium]|nr:tail fiber protein [Planctomycetota bacterium]
MSSPFVAEIRMFPFNFAPKGWAFCDGQILPLSQNTALFSLLGTTYGGDGKSNFALPNLQGNAPMHAGGGQGAGLSQHFLGETGGTQAVTLLQTEIPVHAHNFSVSTQDATDQRPQANQFAQGVGMGMYAATGGLAPLNSNALAPAGGSLPHNNMMPYLTVNFCIALQGVFPARP